MSRATLATIVLLLTTTFFPLQATAQQVHLLILTPADFADELQPLKSWKDETGRPTAIVSLGEIEEADYREVRDQPEKIKRFIADYVVNHGVEHVMLVGDSDRFPVRYILAYHTEWGDKYYPSDLYYMDLWKANGDFDDWDGNGNNIIGEMDVSGGTNLAAVNLDSIDMVPDISLARVPASTDAEVTTYVNKVMAYEAQTSSAYWFRRSLLVVDGGSSPFGSTTKMDEVVGSLHRTTVEKMYQNNAPYSSMTLAQRAAEVNSAISDGVGFVSWYGHGNRLLWAGWYTNNQIAGLTNNTNGRYPIVFATSCYTARFHTERNYYQDVDGNTWTGSSGAFPEPMPVQPSVFDAHNNESMAEHMLVKSAKGAVGYVGCTSKAEHGAWLAPDKGLNPYFYREYDRGVRTLGGMWRGALTRFAGDLNNPATGGMYYYAFLHLHKMILFGDPSLRIPDLPDPAIAANGAEGNLTVSAGTPVTLSLRLDPGASAGTLADWWVLREDPAGIAFFMPGANLWLPGLWISHQGGLFDPGVLTVPAGTLPTGGYVFYFGVDTLANASVSPDNLAFDAVEVTVH